MSFSELTTTQKGDLGESVVDEYIRSKGVVPYKPDADQAHPFDRLCASSDKKSLYVVEVKTKAKRKYYPDTGFNISSYKDYTNIQEKYGLKVFVFFVDEESGEIYGGTLDEISKPQLVNHYNKTLDYPLKQKGIIYFPVSSMRTIGKIDDEIVCQLRQLTTKNELYIN